MFWIKVRIRAKKRELEGKKRIYYIRLSRKLFKKAADSSYNIEYDEHNLIIRRYLNNNTLQIKYKLANSKKSYKKLKKRIKVSLKELYAEEKRKELKNGNR